MAKSPVEGLAKTRLGAVVGHRLAARLALAAVEDTLAVCEEVFPSGRRVVALTGSVEESVDPGALDAALRGWQVVDQCGASFGERIAAAHRTAHTLAGGPVVQIGMDTPHLTTTLLRQVVAGTAAGRPVLGRAPDGGWWVLATTDPDQAAGLGSVPMSRPDTWRRTRDLLSGTSGAPTAAPSLDDVDTEQDARRVAATAPATRFARLWNGHTGVVDPERDSA